MLLGSRNEIADAPRKWFIIGNCCSQPVICYWRMFAYFLAWPLEVYSKLHILVDFNTILVSLCYTLHTNCLDSSALHAIDSRFLTPPSSERARFFLCGFHWRWVIQNGLRWCTVNGFDQPGNQDGCHTPKAGMNNLGRSFYARQQRKSSNQIGIVVVEEHHGTHVHTVRCQRESQIKDGRQKKWNHAISHLLYKINKIPKTSPTFWGPATR